MNALPAALAVSKSVGAHVHNLYIDHVKIIALSIVRYMATRNSSATVILSCPSLPFFASDQTSVSGAPLRLLCFTVIDVVLASRKSAPLIVNSC